MLFVEFLGPHSTQTTLDPPKLKKRIGGKKAYYKNLAMNFLNLCTVGMYCLGMEIVGEFTLLSKKIRILLKHSSIPMANPIIRGVIEVKKCEIRPGNGRNRQF